VEEEATAIRRLRRFRRLREEETAKEQIEKKKQMGARAHATHARTGVLLC
jgi:hypothetical protein